VKGDSVQYVTGSGHLPPPTRLSVDLYVLILVAIRSSVARCSLARLISRSLHCEFASWSPGEVLRVGLRLKHTRPFYIAASSTGNGKVAWI
jgi:hypothetical protein